MKHTMKKDLIATGDACEETRFNALRHGVLSRYTVLPWEDAEEYHVMLAALVAEHSPQGPTEAHLVEELAGIVWRKRRLRLAEGAAHRDRYGHEMELAAGANLSTEFNSSVFATPAETELEIAATEQAKKKTERAVKILLSKRADAYESALKEFSGDLQDWWAAMLEILDLVHPHNGKQKNGRAPSSSNVDRGIAPPNSETGDGTFPVILRWFLETIALPWFKDQGSKLARRPLIRDYVLGKTVDSDKLEKLGRYEVHLDRKLERMLAMLLRLKELRRTVDNG